MDEPLSLVAASEPTTPVRAESFEVFVTASQTRLFGSLCLMTGSRHETEEIAQEAYVRVLERWDHVQRLDDPTGYLFVTALTSSESACAERGSPYGDRSLWHRARTRSAR